MQNNSSITERHGSRLRLIHSDANKYQLFAYISMLFQSSHSSAFSRGNPKQSDDASTPASTDKQPAQEQDDENSQSKVRLKVTVKTYLTQKKR